MIHQHYYREWSELVTEIYEAALEKLDGNENPLHFGPAHIVWEDGNLDSAEWCLEHFDEYLGMYTDEEYKVVKWSLEELAKIPVEMR